MMEQSLNVYPEKPIRIGDTWQRSYISNMGFMEMEMVSTYKLVSVSDDVAHIEINANIKSKPGSTQQTKEMAMEMYGTQQGSMDMDIITGLIKESRLTQSVTGKISVQGLEIPMKLTSTTRIIGKKR